MRLRNTVIGSSRRRLRDGLGLRVPARRVAIRLGRGGLGLDRLETLARNKPALEFTCRLTSELQNLNHRTGRRGAVGHRTALRAANQVRASRGAAQKH